MPKTVSDVRPDAQEEQKNSSGQALQRPRFYEVETVPNQSERSNEKYRRLEKIKLPVSGSHGPPKVRPVDFRTVVVEERGPEAPSHGGHPSGPVSNLHAAFEACFTGVVR